MILLSYINSRLTRKEFFQQVYAKGKSKDAEDSARTSISNLDYYSQDKYQKNTDVILNDINKQDEKVLKYLHDFVVWLSEDHLQIVNKKGKPIKAKMEQSIRGYLGFVRKYLRLCHGIKIDSDDIKDFITIPKDEEESEPEPFTREELLQICNEAKPFRKTFYMVIKDTGGRAKEVLQLKKKNFDFAKNPVLVTFPRGITKGKRATRYQYLTRETAPRVKLMLKNLDDDWAALAGITNNGDDTIEFGYIQFNTTMSETFGDVTAGDTNEVDFEYVAVHETGHLLRFTHSTTSGSVMEEGIGVGDDFNGLHSHDISEIQGKY